MLNHCECGFRGFLFRDTQMLRFTVELRVLNTSVNIWHPNPSVLVRVVRVKDDGVLHDDVCYFVWKISHQPLHEAAGFHLNYYWAIIECTCKIYYLLAAKAMQHFQTQQQLLFSQFYKCWAKTWSERSWVILNMYSEI